jgi:hypothetical protein
MIGRKLWAALCNIIVKVIRSFVVLPYVFIVLKLGAE